MSFFGTHSHPDTEACLFLGIDISAFRRSSIQRATIDAYLGTHYRMWDDTPFVLRIGQRSAELAALYVKYSVSSAAVLTAWNPYSELRSDAENEIAQTAMIAEIDRLALHHQPGHGAADPAGKWPPEPSQLVFGIDLATAESLGRQFRQNGIVWVATDAVPALVLLR
jgi:hypothetical protein